MARVVVGLDGSAQSLQALEHAGKFARAFEHELVGVHVVNPVPEETILPKQGRLRVAQRAAKLERDLARDLARFDGRMRTVYLRAGERWRQRWCGRPRKRAPRCWRLRRAARDGGGAHCWGAWRWRCWTTTTCR